MDVKNFAKMLVTMVMSCFTPPLSRLPSTAAPGRERDFGTGYIRPGTTMSQARREAIGLCVP